ncbi:pentapeptide repeat-containing protein [Nocardia sp. NPDC050408]|uniref:pentapeptide repeat-containing protein n=1 Tax=Nocardia sp. NPDC050408 TaxID=3364319 RepID=UPI0037AAE2F6
MLTTLATLAVAGGTIGALWFTNQSLRATNAQLGLSQQTAVTDRFRLAAEQLASDKVDVRLSGIYLLERLAKDSPVDHATVFAVLAAFVRTHAAMSGCQTPLDGMPVDTQAALTVIGRRDITNEPIPARPNLHRTCLEGADLDKAKLNNVDLISANLGDAYLGDANLEGALLAGARLTLANLYRADLTGAHLVGANLAGANLTDANLTDANLDGVDLTGVDLTGADLRGVHLDSIRYNERTVWPVGFVPPSSR